VITVHHLSSSRSERIVWLLEELAVPYRFEWHQRESTGAAPASMKALHAIGKAPVITDGELTLAESGAIVEYIVRRHGRGRLAPADDSAQFPAYVYWLHFAEGSLMSLMLIALALTRIPEAKESPVRARIFARLAQMLAFVDGEIAQRKWFAGDEFTAADVMMAFPFTTMRRYLDYDVTPYANIASYLERIEARPAYRRAMARAGPDATP
jgi:glutathione S-transferase